MSEPPEFPEVSDPSAIQLDKRSASKAVAWSVLFAIIAKLVFPLATVFLVSGVLGPTIMGAYMLIGTIIAFSELFRDAGLSQTFLADQEADREKEGAYLTIAIIMGALPAIALFLLTPTFAKFFEVPELSWALPLVSSIMLMNGFATIPRTKMLKAGQIKLSGSLDLVGAGIGLCITIVMVAMGYGLIALVIQSIFSSAYGLVVCWLRFPVRALRFDGVAFRQVIKKSSALLAANGLNQLFLFADHIVINKFAGVTANGYFGQAASLAYKPLDLFVFPLTKTLMVAFSQQSVDKAKLASVYARSLAVAIMVVLPIYALLAIFAEPIIQFLLRGKFAGSIPVLAPMCLYLSFRTLGNISGYALVPAGKHAQTLYPWIFGVIGTAIAVYVVTGGAGPFPNETLLMPIVWCFVGGAIFVYSSLLALGLRHCPPEREDKTRIGKAVLILAISSAILLGIRFIPVSMYIQLAIAGILGPIVHGAILGTILAKNPLYYLNRTGPRRLWADL